MPGPEASALEDAFAKKDFSALEAAASSLEPEEWRGLPPLLKLVLFKLLDAPRAMSFYSKLPFPDKYFLLGGFPPASIAPVLDSASEQDRRRFVPLPREFYERMLRELIAEARAAA